MKKKIYSVIISSISKFLSFQFTILSILIFTVYEFLFNQLCNNNQSWFRVVKDLLYWIARRQSLQYVCTFFISSKKLDQLWISVWILIIFEVIFINNIFWYLGYVWFFSDRFHFKELWLNLFFFFKKFEYDYRLLTPDTRIPLYPKQPWAGSSVQTPKKYLW